MNYIEQYLTSKKSDFLKYLEESICQFTSVSKEDIIDEIRELNLIFYYSNVMPRSSENDILIKHCMFSTVGIPYLNPTIQDFLVELKSVLKEDILNNKDITLNMPNISNYILKKTTTASAHVIHNYIRNISAYSISLTRLEGVILHDTASANTNIGISSDKLHVVNTDSSHTSRHQGFLRMSKLYNQFISPESVIENINEENNDYKLKIIQFYVLLESLLATNDVDVIKSVIPQTTE